MKENCLMYNGKECRGLNRTFCASGYNCPFFKDKTQLPEKDVRNYEHYVENMSAYIASYKNYKKTGCNT